MERLKEYIIAFIAGIVVTVLFMLFIGKGCNEDNTVYIHDTTLVTKYETQVQKDTVIKWYQKIVMKEVKPDTVKYQTVDSVFIHDQLGKDLMLGFNKKGTNLRIFALNIEGKLLKEELFTGVYDNFSAYSATGKVVVKTNIWKYETPEFSYEQIRPVYNLKTFTHSVDALTGVSFKNAYYLRAGVGYDGKDLQLKAKLTIKPW